jgi:hypothetical protein
MDQASIQRDNAIRDHGAQVLAMLAGVDGGAVYHKKFIQVDLVIAQRLADFIRSSSRCW